jgi:hypothetical protein
MSAVREVKYLRELHHPNIIEVRVFIRDATNVSPPTRRPRYPSLLKLLDVFSSKTNLNLVLEFLDTDLEMIIKDRSLVFLPADIKSWMAMTFRGLEFCHRNFVLHRVRVSVSVFRFLNMSEGVLGLKFAHVTFSRYRPFAFGQPLCPCAAVPRPASQDRI